MVGDPSNLVAIIIEFFCSVNMEKIKVHPNLSVLTKQLLVRNERCAELGLFVMNKILEPSKEVALQLLESGWQNVQTQKLGLDMLRQLSLYHYYVLMLAQDGHYSEALRYARKQIITEQIQEIINNNLDMEFITIPTIPLHQNAFQHCSKASV